MKKNIQVVLILLLVISFVSIPVHALENDINNSQTKVYETISKNTPKKTTIKKATYTGQKITIKWTKIKSAHGYKIYIAKGNNSYKLYKKVKSNKTTKLTTTKLKRGKTYSFYIKTYKVVKGKTYNSAKSNIKKVRIPSKGDINAKKRAKEYLIIMSFSRQRLIEQLEYNKFTHSQAVYGVDHCGANWNTQAKKRAKSYLNTIAFSRQGLIEQLEYEKFTHSQAIYGVNNCGANWNEQAVRKAKEYLKIFSFSREELIEQLEYEGFTTAQSEYAADQVGY